MALSRSCGARVFSARASQAPEDGIRGSAGRVVPRSLRPMLWDRLTAQRFLERGIVSGPFVRRLLEEHQRGRRNNEMWLWALLVLEMWLERKGFFVSDVCG
jgi:hypothetical protein